VTDYQTHIQVRRASHEGESKSSDQHLAREKPDEVANGPE
jgi:hypothetical protein